jgi:hypothetical protein
MTALPKEDYCHTSLFDKNIAAYGKWPCRVKRKWPQTGPGKVVREGVISRTGKAG